jgi:hypothetical protein
MDEFDDEARRLWDSMFASGKGIVDQDGVRRLASALRRESIRARRLRVVIESMRTHYGEDTVRGKLVRDIIERAAS